MRYLVRIHTEIFILNDSPTLQTVRADIEEASRAGGGFVRIGPADAPEAFITAGTPIFIDTIADDDPANHDTDPNNAFLDLDAF